MVQKLWGEVSVLSVLSKPLLYPDYRSQDITQRSIENEERKN